MDYREKIAQYDAEWHKGRPLAIPAIDYLTYDAPKPQDTDTWGNWVYDSELLTLSFRRSGYYEAYEIDLEKLQTCAEIVDIICQVAEKSWGTPENVGNLACAINDLLQPQKKMCSWGTERGPVNVAEMMKSL